MPSGGLVVLLAPPPGGAEASAARAGLENLARTLSIEWARFGVRPVAVLPGPATTPGEVAELVAYLASPAGAYYSGCAFTLGAV
jgi:citronellol/citronellal dehydrogenase